MTIEGRPSAKTPLLFAGASTRPIEAWTQPASWKIRGNEKHAYFHKSWWKIKGERLSYLRIYLLYIVFLYIFLKKFSLSALARLRFIPHLEMQACNVTLPAPFIYSFILVLLSLTTSFKNSLKTRVKSVAVGGGEGAFAPAALSRGRHFEGRKYGILKIGRFWQIDVCIAERVGS